MGGVCQAVVLFNPCAQTFAWCEPLLSGEVERGITAINGRFSIRAKSASDTAVEPLEASITARL